MNGIVGIPSNATVLTGKEAEKMYLHNIHTLGGKLLSQYHSYQGRKREGGKDDRVAKRTCSSWMGLFEYQIVVVFHKELHAWVS